MIRALVFDCFGVFYPDPVFTYMRDPQNLPDKAETLHSYDEKAARGQLTKSEFIQKAAILLNKPERDIEIQFFQRHNNNQKLIDFIKNVRSKYKTALLSNIGGDMMDGFFTPKERKELFDVVIFSGNEKFAKPDKEFFALACERLGVKPQGAIMIDDLQHNCDAAKSIGMKAICYKDFEQFQTEINLLLKPSNSSLHRFDTVIIGHF